MNRILMIEDDLRLASMVRAYLAQAGFVVAVAEDATRGMAQLERSSWDLVLLDLMLPDARGLDALHRVRARAPGTRIAVMSANEDRDTVDRVLRAGAIGFVPKSADRTTLLDALRRLLELPAAAHGGDGDVPPSRRPIGVPDGVPADDVWIHEALAGLSPRQIQVLRLMVRGLPNKEICRELGLSENTVKIHIGSVLRGLRARNRTEAVSLASRIGFGGR